MTLYEIRNEIDGRKYVGVTSRNVELRWREHRSELKSNRHRNRYLQAAWNKYGENAFKFLVIEIHDSLDALNKAEESYIATHTNLYNLAKGGNANQHAQETKNTISNVQKVPVIGMNIKTGRLVRYPSIADAEKDGFNSKNIGGACRLSTYSGTNRKFHRMSSNDYVWMYQSDFCPKEMERRRKMAGRGKVRLERTVMGLNVLNGELLILRSMAQAAVLNFIPQVVYKNIKNKNKIHKGCVWVYGDSENCLSILHAKAEQVRKNPPTRGPKSCL